MVNFGYKYTPTGTALKFINDNIFSWGLSEHFVGDGIDRKWTCDRLVRSRRTDQTNGPGLENEPRAGWENGRLGLDTSKENHSSPHIADLEPWGTQMFIAIHKQTTNLLPGMVQKLLLLLLFNKLDTRNIHYPRVTQPLFQTLAPSPPHFYREVAGLGSEHCWSVWGTLHRGVLYRVNAIMPGSSTF